MPVLAFTLLAVCSLPQASPPRIQVRMVTDEAEQALRLLALRIEHKTITDSDWKTLFDTEGYKRLKDRELGMKRSFSDDGFKTFINSDDLLKTEPSLRQTLADWKKVDMIKCGETSLAYLPAEAHLHAGVYLLIKPKHNSFVWDTDKPDPAIMLYLDPSVNPQDLAMTVAHEFHHIGFSGCCPSAEFKAWLDKQPKPKQTAYMWLGAFGEGYAVLASAPGLDADPYGPSAADVKKAWKDGIAHQAENFEAVETFFGEVLDGKLDEDKAQEKAMTFFGMVGPWYTVGYIVATTIEKVDGRAKLLECYLDPRLVLPTYNEAAARLNAGLPVFSDELVAKMK